MADFNSSLPMRTETNGDVAVKVVDGATPSQELSVETDGSVNIRLNDGAGTDLTSTAGKLDIALNDESGDPYTPANPLPVVFTSDLAGDEVVNFDQASAIAKDASDNHDYTVTASKTFLIEELWITGSGKMKAEVQLETAAASGVFDTVWVAFNSTSAPNIRIPSERVAKQVAGAIIRIIRTNLDNQPQDLYSTITGLEI